MTASASKCLFNPEDAIGSRGYPGDKMDGLSNALCIVISTIHTFIRLSCRGYARVWRYQTDMCNTGGTTSSVQEMYWSWLREKLKLPHALLATLEE